MKVCPKCGQFANDDSDEFCIKCGAYYNTKQTQQQRTNPMAAAFGMMPAQEASKPVPIPEDGTLEAGFDHMAAGNFSEAMAQWTSYVRNSGQPDQETYARMIDAAVDCVNKQLGSGTAHNQTRIPDLAMELDEDFMQDLTRATMDGVVVDTRDKAADLAKFVQKVAIDSFNVYPDLRDVSECMKEVPGYMDRISEMISGLPDDGGRAQMITDIHRSFSEMMCSIMAEGIQNAGDERMDKLADYWGSKATLPYVNVVQQIYALHSQVSAASNAGKLAKKLFQKGLDMQVDGFRKSYFGPKV